MELKISVINDILDSSSKKRKFVSELKGRNGLGEYSEMQGEYNETFKYYTHPDLPNNIFLQETWRTDSYGNNEFCHSVKFVEGKPKTITIYEPIKD